MVGDLAPPEARRSALRSTVGWAVVGGLVAAVAAAWRFTPLPELLDVARLTRLGSALAAQPCAPAFVLAAYVVGGLLFFPVTVLLTATALIFPQPQAFLYAMGSALASATVTYGVGRLIARHRPGWLVRPTVERLRSAMARRGVRTAIVMRLLPVGNFSLANLVAGAMRLRLRDFLVGSAVGMLPGTVILTTFANRLVATLLHR